WYCAAPPNQYLIGYAESRDGLGGWTKRVPFFSQEIFDATVVRVNNRYEMITARREARFSFDAAQLSPRDGLWWSYAHHLSANPDDWSEPIQLLNANDG